MSSVENASVEKPGGRTRRPREEEGEDSDDAARGKPCIYCSKNPIEFRTVPCGHAVSCRKCAMRLATGGKCKKCGVLFASWERL
ncbi:unnamed protein product [Amoebophrya sp. A120]|nr:unnamed protein product [Amoebophrya sp. A120]|eukprot:GSA120T00005176001.1